jgi:hypothetical protein
MAEVIAKGASREAQEQRIQQLLGELSLDEKIFMLSGHGFLQQIAEDGGKYGARLYHVAAGNERPGIPALLFNDGPRGINMGHSTCFPVPMARGASFDVELSAASASICCATRPGAAPRRPTERTRSCWARWARRSRAGCSITTSSPRPSTSPRTAWRMRASP